MKKSLYIIFLFLLLLDYTFLKSQNNIRTFPIWFNRIGIISSFDYYSSSTDLRQIPNIPDSIRYFANGYNSGFSSGIFLISTFNPKLSLHTRFIYMNGSATISGEAWSETKVSQRDTFSFINHQFTTDLSSLTFEPLLEFEAIKNLSILGGFLISYRLNKTFQHTEKLQIPDSGFFDNGSRMRIVENEFPDLSGFQSAFTAGICYKLPFNITNNGILSLNVYYSYGFSAISNNFVWDINIARAGVNFEYSLNMPEKPIPLTVTSEPKIEITQELKDTSVTIQPAIDEPKSKIDLTIYGTDGKNEFELENIEILESTRENSFPLLNYIFFNENSAKIPDRYYKLTKKETANYNYTSRRPIVEQIDNGIEYVYHDILNIIGYRLRNSKKSTITLIGCNSDTLKEKGATLLSFQRAKAVQSYLTEIWEIPKEKIILEKRNLPNNPSNNNTKDGIEENQRVEIISSSPEIIDAVVYEDTVKLIKPEYIRFRVKKFNIKKILNWKIAILQGSILKKIIESKEDYPEFSEIQLTGNELKFKGSDSILIKANIVYYDNNYNIDTMSIVESYNFRTSKFKRNQYSNSGKLIERYNLILFEFNKAILDKEKLQYINNLNKKINSYDQENIEIKVIGYTDRVGDFKYNLELSKLRAVETAKYIKFLPIATLGYGEDKFIFNNNLPEGRFYSRTVEIIIERNE